MRFSTILLFVLATAVALPAAAQGKKAAGDQPADNMQVLRDKIKADKKVVVAANMGLTENEAKGFWPIYEDYQKELQKLNERTANVIVAYAKEYNADSLTDDKAKSLMTQYLDIQEAEVKLQRSFVPKLAKVLPQKKVARYLQIESKIRAIVKYELAAQVPLVQ
jgi:lipase chaperone LimK